MCEFFYVSSLPLPCGALGSICFVSWQAASVWYFWGISVPIRSHQCLSVCAVCVCVSLSFVVVSLGDRCSKLWKGRGNQESWKRSCYQRACPPAHYRHLDHVPDIFFLSLIALAPA